MPNRVRGYVPRVLITVLLGLGTLPSLGQAQEWSHADDAPLTQRLGALPAPSLLATSDSVVDHERIEPYAATTGTTETGTSRPGALVPLYISFAGLQALDVHSTMRGLDAGAAEANPLLRGVADRPMALVALKAGVAASTIFLAEKMRVRNRVGAVVLMAALNSAYAMVVVHNYRAIP